MTTSIYAIVRRLFRCRRGSVMLELGFIAPIFAAVVLGLVEYGAMTYDATSLESGARAGAQYGSMKPHDIAGIEQAAVNATALDSDTLSVTTTRFCECSGGSAVSCGASCPSGESLRELISVRLTKVKPPGLIVPQIFADFDLSREAIFRLR